jgi:hypothetical protein
MKQLGIVLIGIAALSACSGGREDRVPAKNRVAQQPDLTLPDTLSRKDTSVTLASRTADPAPPAAESTPSVAHVPRANKTRSTPVRHRTRPPVATTKPEAMDTTVRAYAPGGARDTASVSPPDTVASALETNAESTSTSRADTSRAASADTTARMTDSSMTHMADSSTARSADTARAPDTTARATPDTTASAPQPALPPLSAGENRSAASRTLPIGTEIHAALDDSITSRRDTVGAEVDGHVMENVMGTDGRTLIAAGTPVRFTVTQIRPSRSKSSQGRLALRAEGISLAGQLQSVKAEVKPVPRELRGRGVTGSEAAKVGGGAAAGAVIGGAVGKTKGAVIGGVAGAAAGAVVASQTATRDVVVKAKTPVVLVLTAPLVAP